MLSKSEIAQTLLLKMRMRYPANEFTLRLDTGQGNKAHIDIHYDNSKTFSCCIDTLYSAYQKNPPGLKAYCEQMLETIKDFITVVREEKSLLLPMIVNQGRLLEIQSKHLQEKHAGIISGDTSIMSITLAANLFVIFVLDTSSRITYPTVEQLWQFLPYKNTREVYQAALKNLTSLLPQLNITSSPFGSALHFDSNYEPSFLLIYEHWKERLPFTAPPVIAAVARDTIILADSTQKKYVRGLGKILQKTSGHIDDALSSELLVIYNNEIKLLKETP